MENNHGKIQYDIPHIYSLSLSLSLLLIHLPASAQITINDLGNLSIGGSSVNNARKLWITCSNATGCSGSVRYGIDVRTDNATNTAFGLNATSVSSSSNTNVGVRGHAANGGTFNAGISGVGPTGGWAGYFYGNVHTTGTYSSSDERLKEDIRFLDGSDILARLLQLEPRIYRFKNPNDLKANGLPSFTSQSSDQIGLLAQEVEYVFPEVVIDVINPLDYNLESDEEMNFVTTKAINYPALIPALIAGLKEQQVQIAELKNRISALENQ